MRTAAARATSPAFTLLDTGAFNDNRYFDVEVRYCEGFAGRDPHPRHRHQPRAGDSDHHLIPQLWFRNDWSWGDPVDKPVLRAIAAPTGAQWAVQAEHPTLGVYHLYGRHAAKPLYTENESNAQRLWNVPGASPYVKDAFPPTHRERRGRCGESGAHRHQVRRLARLQIDPGHAVTIGLTLVARSDGRSIRQARSDLRQARGGRDHVL
jgi:hypothetical protein